MMRGKKGKGNKPFTNPLHPPQSPEDAELAKRAFAAQKELRATLTEKLEKKGTVVPLVGLSLGTKGYSVLVFTDDQKLKLPATIDGFPVVRRSILVSPSGD